MGLLDSMDMQSPQQNCCIPDKLSIFTACRCRLHRAVALTAAKRRAQCSHGSVCYCWGGKPGRGGPPGGNPGRGGPPGKPGKPGGGMPGRICTCRRVLCATGKVQP